jgi:hypothetical protein
MTNEDKLKTGSNMHFKCNSCGKKIILGHDLKYELGISFTDPSHKNIFSDKKQYELYCESCELIARERFNELIDDFNN